MSKTIIAGLDIGNGYVKGRYQGSTNKSSSIDMASCVASLVNRPSLPEAPEHIMDDIFNNMICSINSPIVAGTKFYAFGTKAIGSGRSLLEFDIAAASLSKAEQPLSSILVLGSVAGAALKDYWDKNNSLPNNVLEIDVCAALALPIDEYKEHRDAFSKKFTDCVHEVTICNFEQSVVIRIHFVRVSVLAEGVSAQFAINSKGEAFAQALLDDVRSHDPNALAGITAADVVGCCNTCGIDIGEGTVNFPVISLGASGSPQFNSLVSRTIQKGYGTVLEQALPAVQNANMPYNTRKALANFLQSPVTAFNQRKMNTVKDIVNAEAESLADDIVLEISRILTSGMIEVIYVYGGGATPMKEVLYDMLIEKTKSFSGGDALPILYLDSYYSRDLNREGLYQVAMEDYKYLKSKN